VLQLWFDDPLMSPFTEQFATGFWFFSEDFVEHVVLAATALQDIFAVLGPVVEQNKGAAVGPAEQNPPIPRLELVEQLPLTLPLPTHWTEHVLPV